MVKFRKLPIGPLKSFKCETHHINLKILPLCSAKITVSTIQKNFGNCQIFLKIFKVVEDFGEREWSFISYLKYHNDELLLIQKHLLYPLNSPEKFCFIWENIWQYHFMYSKPSIALYFLKFSRNNLYYLRKYLAM